MNAPLRRAVLVLALAPLAVVAPRLPFAHHLLDPGEARRDEELQRLRRATLDRQEARRQVVQEVIARRLSLGEALAQFRELEREWPDYATPLAKVPGPRSEEERHYEQLTALVGDLLGQRPEEAAATLRRLEDD
jgi:hypothetical protein